MLMILYISSVLAGFMEIFIPQEMRISLHSFQCSGRGGHLRMESSLPPSPFHMITGGMLVFMDRRGAIPDYDSPAGIVIVVIGIQMVAPDVIHSFVPRRMGLPFLRMDTGR